MWQDEWPTEPGYWWFYGWCFKKSTIAGRQDKPEMLLIEVRKSSNDVMMYSARSHFLYKDEGAEGKWMKAELPTPPQGMKAR